MKKAVFLFWTDDELIENYPVFEVDGSQAREEELNQRGIEIPKHPGFYEWKWEQAFKEFNYQMDLAKKEVGDFIEILHSFRP